MSADKYPSIFSRQMATIVYIFSRQMEAIVYIFSSFENCVCFHKVLKNNEHHSLFLTRKCGRLFVLGRRCFGGNAEQRQTNIRFKQRNFGKWSRIGYQGRHLHDQEKLRFLRRRLLYSGLQWYRKKVFVIARSSS